MVNFVLNDLSRPADKSLDTGLKLLVLPLDFNGLVAFTRAWATEQGKTTLFRVYGPDILMISGLNITI